MTAGTTELRLSEDLWAQVGSPMIQVPHTEAYIGGSSMVDAGAHSTGLDGIYNGSISNGAFGTQSGFHGLAVQAASSENVFGLAISIGGGFVGVAGGIGVDLLHVGTQSFIAGGAQINTLAGADSSQSVNVSAVDLAKTLTIGGGGGGGFVGAGAGIDIGILQVTAKAYLGSDKLGDLIRQYPNVSQVFCGHSHFPAQATIDHLRATNIGSSYRHKTVLTVDLPD